MTFAPSTAMAASLVAAGEHDAAICGATGRRGLRPATSWRPTSATGPAETRFVLVSTPQPPQPATGADKTSLVLFMGEDHPGALLEILTEFAVRGVNLTRIESRPTGGGIGDYFFSVDVEGHLDDARVGEALMGLRRVCAEVRYLGSYPRLDGSATGAPAGGRRRRVSCGAGLVGANSRGPGLISSGFRG